MHRTLITVLSMVLLAWAIAGGDSSTFKGDPNPVSTTVSSGTVTAGQGTSPFVTSINTGTYAASVETRKQTPTGSNALNVMIGPGDVISNIPVVMDFGQHQIHESESWMYGYYSTSVGSTTDFVITVPTFTNTIQGPHMLIHAAIYEGAGELSLWEGPTYSSGSTVTIYNRNRNTGGAPLTTIKSGVSTTTTGTRLPATAFLTAGSKFGGGETRSVDEIILKSNTEYLVRFEEITAVSRMVIHFEWYEDLGL